MNYLYIYSDFNLQKAVKNSIFIAFAIHSLSAYYKHASKRALTRGLKGVNKVLKGHLLEGKRALIEIQLTPSYFLIFEFSLHVAVV